MHCIKNVCYDYHSTLQVVNFFFVVYVLSFVAFVLGSYTQRREGLLLAHSSATRNSWVDS